MTRVAIGIPSYRRPRGLFSLLGALDGLVFEDTAPELRIVVVDNDAAGTARPVVEDARSWLRWPIDYVIEKRKGIPQARNAVVAAAMGSEWLAFVDDDETPDLRWLETLLRVQRETGADVVTGPALPRYAQEPPAWVRAGGFFDPPRHATGTRLDTAYTNNVLARTEVLARLGSLFDERLTLGVGEDTELFGRVAAAGGAIVWADEARVYENVPRERVGAGWIARRGWRVGVATTHLDRLRRGRRSDGRIAAHGAWCVTRGLAEAATSALRGPAAGVQGLRLACYGAGRLAGLLGLR